MAQERARAEQGTLILRNDDLDRARCKPEFVEAMFEDLRWFGFEWAEGPDRRGPFSPYNQSERYNLYRAAFEQMRSGGFIYPCTCSRKDIQAAASAPHAGDDELIYPGTCRAKSEVRSAKGEPNVDTSHFSPLTSALPAAWRFRIPDGETISFIDGRLGQQQFVAGKDFGDFVIWRSDDVPAYQLACVVDDAAMQITEVVRGADLLISTARQMLLYRALNLIPPAFYHCALMTDESGVRLAKRHDALSLKRLREEGIDPETLRPGQM
jgi:glutamyl-tRNA synthetase